MVLQYHHVSDETPASTSISPAMFEQHLEWLEENQFSVLPLPKLVNTLKNKQAFKHSKVVAITFDDANRSVCDIAWPILKKHQLAFTVFINTDPIAREFKSQCTWPQLQEMTASGLMTPANHSHRHLNMISAEFTANPVQWREMMREEIMGAQRIIDNKLRDARYLFAYPYGEYNTELSELVSELGFIGFGQQSGAIGHHSDFSALPRFPASGQFANLETLSTKLMSLAFPAKFVPGADNPIQYTSEHNPPLLTVSSADQSLLASTRCYNKKGQVLPISRENNQLLVRAETTLEPGRHRYTCTSQSPIPERFYWFSHQWLVEAGQERSFGEKFMDLFK